MAIYKRYGLYRTKFTINGKVFRLSLDTADWREAARRAYAEKVEREKELLLQDLKATEVMTARGLMSTARGISESCAVPITLVLQLAADGRMPHSRIIGYEGPLFHEQDARRWIAQNLVQHVDGRGLPPPEITVIQEPQAPPERNASIPASLAQIKGLRKIYVQRHCGIYFLCLSGEVVYVGQSLCVETRVAQHRKDGKEFHDVFFLAVPQAQLSIVEAAFIKRLNPILNRVGKERIATIEQSGQAKTGAPYAKEGKA